MQRVVYCPATLLCCLPRTRRLVGVRLLATMATPTISVIIPLYNANETIRETLDSVATQNYAGHIEACIYNDCSKDSGEVVVRDVQAQWAAKFGAHRCLKLVTLTDVGSGQSLGPGFARNRAVDVATGDYVAMLDADDVCEPDRLQAQLDRIRASADPYRTLVGTNFVRMPADATPVYTAWLNRQPDDHSALSSSAWREVPMIQPSWFMARVWFEELGGYDERPPELPGMGPPGLAMRPTRSDDGTSVDGSGAGGQAPSTTAATPTGALARHPPILGDPPYSLGLSVAHRRYEWPTVPEAQGGAGTDTSGGTAAASLAAGGPASTNSVGQASGPGPSPATAMATAAATSPLSPSPALSHPYIAYPEDTIFIHRHLAAGGLLAKAGGRTPSGHSSGDSSSTSTGVTAGSTDSAGASSAQIAPAQPILPLLRYRFSPGSQSWRMSRDLLLKIKVALWEERCLWGTRPPMVWDRHGDAAGSGAAASAPSTPGSSLPIPAPTQPDLPSVWSRGFLIWGAGRDGKALYKALSYAGRALVRGFIDVDPAKVGHVYPLPNSPDQKDNEEAIRAAGLTVRSHGSGAGRKHGLAGKGAGESNRAKKRRLRAEATASGSSSIPVAEVAGGQDDDQAEATAAPQPVLLPLPVPIVHLTDPLVVPPILVAVSQDFGGPALQANVQHLEALLEQRRATAMGTPSADGQQVTDNNVAASGSSKATGPILVDGLNLIYMV